MFFKNLRLYRLHAPLPVEALTQAAPLTPARPCGALETETLGWWPPLGRGHDQYTHTTMGRTMMCARRMQKVLPAPAVKELVDARAYEIEQAEGRPVRSKERKAIQEEVIQKLLPDAIQQPKDVYLYCDPVRALVAIDTSSETIAADVLNLLRRSLGSLRATPIRLNHAPHVAFTRWVADKPPAPFTLGDEIALEDPGEDGRRGRFSHHDLGADTIRAHIKAGMVVTKIALDYWGNDGTPRASLVVSDDLAVSKLHLHDVATIDLLETDTETDADRFDAEFALMAAEVDGLVGALIKALGGEEQPEEQPEEMGEAA